MTKCAAFVYPTMPRIEDASNMDRHLHTRVDRVRMLRASLSPLNGMTVIRNLVSLRLYR